MNSPVELDFCDDLMQDTEIEQMYTQEDYDAAQRALLRWMLPIIHRITTTPKDQPVQQHAA